MAYSRPSSSGGRLEQHLGAVESSSVDPSSPSILGPTRSIPASQKVIYPASGPRIGSTAVAAASGSSPMAPKTGDTSGRGGGGTRSLGAPGDSNGSTRAFKGGAGAGGSSTSAGFGSSASRAVLGEQQAVVSLFEAAQQQQQHTAVGRKTRDRRAGGGSNRRRVPTDLVICSAIGQATTGTDIGAKGGAGRGKVDTGGTRARRAVSQVSLNSSSAVEGGGGGGDDRGGEFGAGLGVRRGRRPNKNDTEDHKFRMQAGQSNTLVAVRLRPLLNHDREHVEVAKVGKPSLVEISYICQRGDSTKCTDLLCAVSNSRRAGHDHEPCWARQTIFRV